MFLYGVNFKLLRRVVSKKVLCFVVNLIFVGQTFALPPQKVPSGGFDVQRKKGFGPSGKDPSIELLKQIFGSDIPHYTACRRETHKQGVTPLYLEKYDKNKMCL